MLSLCHGSVGARRGGQFPQPVEIEQVVRVDMNRQCLARAKVLQAGHQDAGGVPARLLLSPRLGRAHPVPVRHLLTRHQPHEESRLRRVPERPLVRDRPSPLTQ